MDIWSSNQRKKKEKSLSDLFKETFPIGHGWALGSEATVISVIGVFVGAVMQRIYCKTRKIEKMLLTDQIIE